MHLSLKPCGVLESGEFVLLVLGATRASCDATDAVLWKVEIRSEEDLVGITLYCHTVVLIGQGKPLSIRNSITDICTTNRSFAV